MEQKHAGIRRAVDTQAKDAGLALALIAVLAGLWLQARWPFWAAAAVLVLGMVAPRVLRPFAALWFGLGGLLGAVTSRIVLGVLFFFVATPVGLLRRLLGGDPMQLRRFRRDRESMFTVRDHQYTAADLEQPY